MGRVRAEKSPGRATGGSVSHSRLIGDLWAMASVLMYISITLNHCFRRSDRTKLD